MRKQLLPNNELHLYFDKIDQQRSEINTLLVEVKQYQNRIHRPQKNATLD